MPTTDDVTFRDHALELTRYATAIAGPTDADDIVASAFARAMSSTNWHTILDRRAYLRSDRQRPAAPWASSSSAERPSLC